MALIDEMKVAREEPIVGFAEFLKSCQPGSSLLYCFMEAKDDEIYYSSIIRSIIDKEFETFKCRNKDGVIKVYHLIKAQSSYQNIKTGFFVDRDFDPLINNPYIFETPFHSIENFYTDIGCIKKIFHQQFGIDRVNDAADYSICVNLYLSLQEEFHNKVLNLNAWLCCHADERNNGNCLRINVDDKIKWQEVVSPDLDAINIPNYTYDEINQLLNTRLISEDVFQQKIEAFKTVEAAHTFRGKFEIRFLISFLKMFCQQISKPRAKLCKRRYSTNLQFKLENVITILSSYAFVPTCLKEYIVRIAT